MGKDKDRELATQPLANTTQPQAQSNPNKCIINLYSTPLPQAPRIPFIQRAKLCCSTKKSHHLEYIASIESVCQKLDHQEARELRADINRVIRSFHPPKPNLIKEELKGLAELRKDNNRIVLTADKGLAMVVID